MYESVADFLEEYDELARDVMLAEYRMVAARLKQWFELLDEGEDNLAAHIKALEGRRKWDWLSTGFLPDADGVGGAAINMPDRKDDRLTFQLHLFRRLSTGELDILNFSHDYFPTRSNNVNEIVSNMMSQLFGPFVSELRRYLRRAWDEKPETPTTLNTIPTFTVPASDRVVPINHNAPEFQELMTGLEGLEEQIRSSNNLQDEERTRSLAEVRATKELLQPDTAQEFAIRSFVIPALATIGALLVDNVGGGIIQHTIMPSLKALFPMLFGS